MTDDTRTAVHVLGEILCANFDLGHDHEHVTPRIYEHGHDVCPDGPDDAATIIAALQSAPESDRRLLAAALLYPVVEFDHPRLGVENIAEGYDPRTESPPLLGDSK